MSLTSRFRRLGAALAATLMALAGLVVVAAPAAQATPGFDLERLSGPTRFDTAAEIAREVYPDGVERAVLANGLNFPDALAATYFAGTIDAPILLSGSKGIPAPTLTVLADLGVNEVTLIGGPTVLGPEVEAQLDDNDIAFERIGGATRYDTAERVARDPGAAAVGTLNGDKTAIVATGEDFADALVAGPIAHSEAFPIVLTPGAALGADARAALTALAIDHVILVGGESVLKPQVASDIQGLGISTQRLFGGNRFSTATAIAEFAYDTLGFDREHVNVATGLDFPDAIAGGVLGGVERAPIVLAATSVPPLTCDFLGDRDTTLASGHALGGGAVLPGSAIGALETCAGALPTNQTYALTPTDDDTAIVDDSRAFTVTDLGDASAVDVGLIDCANISIAGSFVTFAVTDGSATGLGTTAAATITRLNGVDGDNGDLVSDATVVDGTITLEITADAAGCVAVVAFADADGNDALAVDAQGAPTEDFAASGRTTIFDIAGLDVSPVSALRPFGKTATATAQVVDSDDAPSPAAGLPVLFTVEELSGPGFDDGGCGTIDPSVSRTEFASGTTITNLAGVASFTYTGPVDPSGDDDLVIHCIDAVLDLDESGDESDGDFAGSTQVDFDDTAAAPDAVVLTAPGVTGLVGTQATFEALLTDQYGDPLANRVLTVELFRVGTVTPQFVVTRTTGADGVASLTYTGPAGQIDDTVVVCLENPSDANARCDVLPDGDASDDEADVPNDQAPFRWVTSPTVPVETGHDSCVLAANIGNDNVDVEDSANAGRNLRLRYDANDQFNLVTTQGPIASVDPILFSQFEANASAGDRIHVEYEPGGVSVFTLYDDTNCTQDIDAGEASTNGAFG